MAEDRIKLMFRRPVTVDEDVMGAYILDRQGFLLAALFVQPNESVQDALDRAVFIAEAINCAPALKVLKGLPGNDPPASTQEDHHAVHVRRDGAGLGDQRLRPEAGRLRLVPPAPPPDGVGD